jgi:hypothetical protein
VTTPRCGVLAKALLAAYVLAAALLPFAHHDVVCHLKSSTHCTSCLASSSGEAASGVTPLEGATFNDAGQAIPTEVAFVHSAVISASAGRSPPALG